MPNPDASTTTTPQSASDPELEAVDLGSVTDDLTLDSLAIRTEIIEAAAEAESCSTLAALTRDTYAFLRIDRDASERTGSAERVAEMQTPYTVAILRGTYRHHPAFQALGELTDRLGELARSLEELADDALDV